MKTQPPICPHCSEPAQLVDSKIIYRTRSYGMVWLCQCLPGWAYVGVHDGSDRPKGSLADKPTREARKKAHLAFDPLWLEPKIRRRQRRILAYEWLTNALKIDPNECHIGLFDVGTCGQLVQLCDGKDKFE